MTRKPHKLIVVALYEEFPSEMKPSGYNLIYTGIGKVNAAIALTKYLTTNPHVDAVYNYGTAGASDPDVAGELLEVGAVLERDMDLTALGVPMYVTERGQNPLIYTDNKNTEIVCGTGDSFSQPEKPYHIVDMEAYALASVCFNFDVPFHCYKYISDTSADEDQAQSWKDNVSKGAKKFLNRLT